MRAIKFRAWDSECMRYLDDAEFEITYAGVTEVMDSGSVKRRDWPLMQYIGLNDANGKEIYEGDVVLFTVFDYNGSDSQHRGVIVNTGQRVMIWPKPNSEYWGRDGGYDFDVIHYEDDELEVIGNIYENPNLLETK